MGDEAAIPVLRRKVGGARAARKGPQMTPEKALRAAVARAGDATLGAPVSLKGLTVSTDLPEALMDGLPEPALFALLEGPDGQVALAVACPQVVAAAIEAQTLGQVIAGEAATRRPTGTDAAMLADFLDRVLADFAALARAVAELPPLDRFRYARTLTDARAGAMALADLSHLHCAAELDFGLGAKTGKLILLIPAERPGRTEGARDGGTWQAALQRAVLGTEARLEAVLCRVQKPLSEIGALAVGDVIKLGNARLTGVSLRGSDGGKVITGKLGRSGTMRAVRLSFAAPVPTKVTPKPAEAGPSESGAMAEQSAAEQG